MTDEGQERALGRVEGKFDHIIRDQEQAGSDRKQQYERQEKTERLLEEMSRQMKGMNHRLEKVEEPVADFNRWRERGVGAICVYPSLPHPLADYSPPLGKRFGR